MSFNKISPFIPPCSLLKAGKLEFSQIHKIYLSIPEDLSFKKVYTDFMQNELKLEKDRSEDSRVNY